VFGIPLSAKVQRQSLPPRTVSGEGHVENELTVKERSQRNRKNRLGKRMSRVP
jgi:hypothetical protein